MRYNKFKKRIISLFVISILMTQNVSGLIPVFAYNVDIDEDNIHIDIDVVANHRTMGLFDSAKISNTQNRYKSDYQPNFDDSILDIFQEYKLSDIVEYDYFKSNGRNPVYVREDNLNIDGYAYKLQYLIENNIINRTTDYVYNKTDVYEGMDRNIHPNTAENVQINVSEMGYTQPKYYDSALRISKTDFLSELMKIADIRQSRLIGVKTGYNRVNENLKTVEIESEPLELSPYQREFGLTGLDSLSNDVIINHSIFGQLNLIVTNDVVEYYLNDAINKGIISTSEIGGEEGNLFLSNRPTGKFTPPGSWHEQTPLRQFYDREVSLSEKIIESKGDYSEQLDDFLEPKQKITSDFEISDGLEYPWGNSYYYSNDECMFGNPFNKEPTEIIKRFSVVEVQQGLSDTIRDGISGSIDSGYQYFTDENLTLADAYIIVYKFMISNGEEETLTQQEVDYINSMYALDFKNLRQEETDAVKYLIAKGVLDPDVDNIEYSTSTQLTNGTAVDLLYRVHNQNHRKSFIPELSEIDKDMLDRGYSKSTVNIQSPGSGSSAGRIGFHYVGDNNLTESLQANQLNDRIENPYNYNYLYIRYPIEVINNSNDSNELADSVDSGSLLNSTIKLLVNDQYRIEIDPYNLRLNGGISDEVEEVLDENGEHILDDEGNPITKPVWENTVDASNGEILHHDDYVYKGPDGYIWGRYIVNKDSSNNLRMLVTFKDGTVKEYRGFSGEGVYILTTENSLEYKKISLSDAQTSDYTNKNNSIYSKVIANDIKTRTFLSNNRLAVVNEDTNIIIGQDYAVASEYAELETNDTNQYKNNNLSKTNQLQGELIFGPMSDIDLENLLFNGVQLVENTANGYQINKMQYENQNLVFKKVENMSIKEDIINNNKLYYITYKPIGSNIALESSEIYKLLDMQSGSITTKFPAYSKYTYNGEQISLISKDELTTLSENNFNIEALSDKLLWNKSTGQRAFLNTDENFTLIGNNITRYPKNTTMVISMGGKVFYNLDIIVELLNDSNTFCNKAGKNIYLSSRIDNTMSNNVIYKNVPVYDNIDKTYVDKTYLFTDKSGIFLSISALTDKCSNMLYFKDKTINGLEALIVYYPKITNESLKNNKDIIVDNGVIGTMNKQKSQYGISDMYNAKFENPTKILSSYLFSGGAGENLDVVLSDNNSLEKSASEVLPSGYQYNIYFLIEDSAENNINGIWTDFVNRIQDVKVGNYSGRDMLSQSIIDEVIPQDIKISKLGLNNSDDVNNSNIMFSVLQVSSNSFNNTDSNYGKYLFRDSSSNNLYFRITNSDNSINAYEYAKIFKNRFYGVSTDNTITEKSLLKPLITESTNNDTGCLTFQQQKYYYKTPEGYVPLELYSMGKGTLGNLSDKKDYRTEQDYSILHKINSSDNNDSAIEVEINNRDNIDVDNQNYINTDVYNGNILINYPISKQSLNKSTQKVLQSKDNQILSTYDTGMFTPISENNVSIFDNNFINTILTSKAGIKSENGSHINFIDAYDSYMNEYFTKYYCPSDVISSEVNENSNNNQNMNTVKKFVLDTSIELSNYTGYNLKNTLISNSLKNKSNIEYQLQGIIASSYEDMWDIVTNKSILGNKTDINTFSYDDKTYICTFQLGKPSKEILNNFVQGEINKNILSGNRKDISDKLGQNNSEYNDKDDYYAYFAISEYNKINPADIHPVAIAGLKYTDLDVKKLYKGKNNVEILWKSAWQDNNIFIVDKIYNNFVKNISIWNNLVDCYQNENPKIYFQKMVLVPAGTTLVDDSGRMITLLSDKIRYEMNYTGDIINTLLARMSFLITEDDSIMFLGDVPKNGVIHFSNTSSSSDSIVIKLTESQNIKKSILDDDVNKRNINKIFKYSDVLTLPDEIVSDMNRNLLYSYDDVNDFTIAYKLLNSIFNIEIPTAGAGAGNIVNGSRIKLGSVIGNGLWRLPSVEEFEDSMKALKSQYNIKNSNILGSVLNKIGSLLNTNQSIMYWSYYKDYEDIVRNKKVNDSIKLDDKSKTIVSDVVLYSYDTKIGKSDNILGGNNETYNNINKNQYNGYLTPVVSMPPTIVVKEVQNDGNVYYEVQYYLNPSSYGIDLENDYVNFLTQRNTDAYDPLKSLGGLKSNSFDGNMYKKYYISQDILTIFNSVLGFLRFALPFLLISSWALVTYLYVMSKYLAIPHHFFTIISDRLGCDIVKILSFGVLDIDGDIPLTRWFIYTILLWTVAVLLFGGLLQSFIVSIFSFVLDKTFA